MNARLFAALAASILCLSPRPAEAAFPQDFLWGISWHPDALTEGRSLEVAKELGVGLLRFDVMWSDFQPVPGPFHPEQLALTRTRVRNCRKQGFTVKVNLVGYPSWALELLKRDPEAFFVQYRQYVRSVVETLGDQVDFYQIGNEFNTLFDPVPAEWDARVFREAGTEIERSKQRWPRWQVRRVINACDSFYLPWKRTLEKVLDESGPFIDVIGYDFYPGNYSHFTDWSAWPEIPYLGELAKKYDKEIGICETGCPGFFGEGRQANWIKESTRGMLKAIAASPLRDRFRFAILYELTDSPKRTLWPPPSEATFGMVGLDGRRKPAFDAFQQVIKESGSRTAGGFVAPSVRSKKRGSSPGRFLPASGGRLNLRADGESLPPADRVGDDPPEDP